MFEKAIDLVELIKIKQSMHMYMYTHTSRLIANKQVWARRELTDGQLGEEISIPYIL